MTEKDYLRSHSTPASEALLWLERQTHLRTNHARMLSGREQGSLLALISRLARPANILELGVFTGYSTICLAEGLAEGGTIHAVEINDELEPFTRPWIEGKNGQRRNRLTVYHALAIIVDTRST